MFGKVMEDTELCKAVLECLLGRKIGNLEEVIPQKEFKYISDGKPIRLDVYNKDDYGEIYDTELENLNHKSVESHMLPQRSRYYQSSIDIDYMEKGYSYKRLPESNVLFICTFDPFGQGLSQYSFPRICEENSALYLNDGTHIIFFNCTYKGNDISENLRNFYDYVMSESIADALTKRLDEAVTVGRRNEKWRTQYMKEWVLLQDAKDEGREEGIEEGEGRAFRKSVIGMLSRGKTSEEIADFCGYPLEQVREVEHSLLANEPLSNS